MRIWEENDSVLSPDQLTRKVDLFGGCSYCAHVNMERSLKLGHNLWPIKKVTGVQIT
jgi:hypothetical protein